MHTVLKGNLKRVLMYIHTMGYLCEGKSSLVLETTLTSTFCLPGSFCFPFSPEGTSVTTVHMWYQPQILLINFYNLLSEPFMELK